MSKPSMRRSKSINEIDTLNNPSILNKSDYNNKQKNILFPLPYSKYYMSSSSQELDDEPKKLKFKTSVDRESFSDQVKEILHVEKCLEQLSYKRQYFAENAHSMPKKLDSLRYKKAYTSIDEIYEAMDKLLDNYKTEEITLFEFKTQALDCLQNKHQLAMKNLSEHRGCKEILVNLIAAVFALPIYLASALCKGTFFVFRPQTDVRKKVDALIRAVEAIDEEENTERFREQLSL